MDLLTNLFNWLIILLSNQLFSQTSLPLQSAASPLVLPSIAASPTVPIPTSVPITPAPSVISATPNPKPTTSTPIPSVPTTSFFVPSIISIPNINLYANLESVGLGSDRLQIVPDSPSQASWFKLGTLPGQIGSAVIAGHFTLPKSPGVFYHLHQLKQGDVITLFDSHNEKLNFVIEDIKTYTRENFPTYQVYNANDKRRLNLITCSGKFLPNQNDYDQRLVVYAVLS